MYDGNGRNDVQDQEGEMRESTIERYLVKQVAKAGGRAYKWVSPGNRGVPDRLVMFRNVVVFAEVKTETGRLSSQQEIQHRKIRDFNFPVWVLRSKDHVDFIIRQFS